MAKTKIAHLLHSLGGVDIYVRLLLNNIDTDSFENIVIHGTKDTAVPFLDKNKKNLKEYKISIFREISIFNDLKATYQTYQILKKEKPDLIHSHSAKGGIIGRVLGPILGVKVIYTPHAFSYLSSQSKLKRGIFLAIEKLLAKRSSLLLATSNSEKKRAIDEVGFDPQNTIVFNNCIEPILKIEPLSIPKTWPDYYICTVGRPSYQKNIEQMVRVMNEVNKEVKIHLVVMGVGPVSDQLESVKSLIQELDMENEVTLLSWTERTDVFNIIDQSKLYISTARYEGLPYAVIESLALSKPCVVTNCDGNRDLIKDGFNGFVINEDVIQFKEKILELLGDEKLLERMSKKSQQVFAENFSIKSNIKQLEAIYKSYN
ncbi:glycosyltransferase [Flavobacterium degerlachei]|jgi:glycosyltransferase involved in cell wall biosynthesis|uniref:Glycosyltransferase involved in cell wall bisynthesis n=1 Tax=Flavobacterium degerlachei TaxID=229203 RepID=A0A1H2QY12_9FLAO|nr:glycosyltransferase [Flavobacterium degerlachei]SDW11329.1 Glycosyltransferase involved in cell wall bisynthesis [Flavobacterium degerlachei]